MPTNVHHSSIPVPPEALVEVREQLVSDLDRFEGWAGTARAALTALDRDRALTVLSPDHPDAEWAYDGEWAYAVGWLRDKSAACAAMIDALEDAEMGRVS